MPRKKNHDEPEDTFKRTTEDVLIMGQPKFQAELAGIKDAVDWDALRIAAQVIWTHPVGYIRSQLASAMIKRTEILRGKIKGGAAEWRPYWNS